MPTKAETELVEIAFTPGATFTPAQAEAWGKLRAKIRNEGYREAQALLLNHKRWFEREPHAMIGFMAVHDAFQAAAKEVGALP